MKTRPPAALALSALLALLPMHAAASLPSWPPADEGWSVWSNVIFQDAAGKRHSLWCHIKECGGGAGTAALLLFTQGKIETLSEGRTRKTIKTQLSAFSLDLAKHRVIDPVDRKEYPISFGAQVDAPGNVIRVLPPTSKANDAARPAAKPAPKPKRPRKPAKPKPAPAKPAPPKPTPAPAPPAPPSKPKPPEGRAGSALDFFSHPVEKALAEFLLARSPDQAKEEALLIETLKKPESDPARIQLKKWWTAKILDRVKGHLAKSDPELDSFLKGKSLTQKDLLAYFCPSLVPANVDRRTAYAQLVAMSEKSRGATQAATAEEARTQAQPEVPPVVVNLCMDFFKDEPPKPAPPAAQPESKTGLATPSPQPSLTIKPVPEPQGEAAKGKKPWWKLELGSEGTMDAIAGGSLGAGALGLLAMGAAAGPAGIFGAALLGAVIGFGLMAMKSAGKDKKK
ncbi:MAG: hypothetical protein PHF00_00370 [Elusimicrobia bacterium]|nr:hypothetical protein [Elusimicrobiota bacterium]